MSALVGACRLEVYGRDQGCVARMVDPESGPCYDAWGVVIANGFVLPYDVGEMDYVRLGATGDRHQLPEDHVWLCPGHHRGTGPSRGYVWATANRRKERDYLDRVNGVIRIVEAEMTVDGEPVGLARDIVIRTD